MSLTPPVLWLSTHAVEPTAPLGDDGRRNPGCPIAKYIHSTADRPYRRRRPPDVRYPACPMAEYNCSTADFPYRRRRRLDVLQSRLPVLWLSTAAVQQTAPKGDEGHLMSFTPAPPMAYHRCSTTDRPYRDDGHRMSSTPPILWASTNAAQPSAPEGDDGHRMDDGDRMSLTPLVCPKAEYKRSTADRPYGRRQPSDVLNLDRPMALYMFFSATRRAFPFV